MKNLILACVIGLLMAATATSAAADAAATCASFGFEAGTDAYQRCYDRAVAAATCQSRGLPADTDEYAACHRAEIAAAACRSRGTQPSTPAFTTCVQEEIGANIAVAEFWAEMRKLRQEQEAAEAAQEDPERQEWISIFSAQCRYEGIQDGTPAMSDCIRVKAFETYQRNEDRLSQERAAQEPPGFAAPPNYTQPRNQPTSTTCYFIGATLHCTTY